MFLNFIPMAWNPGLCLTVLLIDIYLIRRKQKIKKSATNLAQEYIYIGAFCLTSWACVAISVSLQPTHLVDLSRQNYTIDLVMRTIVLWQVLETISQLNPNFLRAKFMDISEKQKTNKTELK
jgi:hypothetical protein